MTFVGANAIEKMTVKELLEESRADRLMKKELNKLIEQISANLANGNIESADFPEPLVIPKQVENSTEKVVEKATKIELQMANKAAEYADKRFYF
ncbi:MAG: hypothetical protein CMM93_06980 [Rickettsiales bacterium]|nr:hypothetical protein [Rickettsiales bacterium]